MNFALMYDCCIQDSFYVKDGMSYAFKDDKPYTHTHSRLNYRKHTTKTF